MYDWFPGIAQKLKKVGNKKQRNHENNFRTKNY